MSRRDAERAGRRAETLACLLLRLKGYAIEARNYRCPAGEIDIVARRWRAYAFVEVKARGSREAALRAVTPSNWQRIARAAQAYQARRLHTMTASVRFDLVTVVRALPRHHRDAWRPGG